MAKGRPLDDPMPVSRARLRMANEDRRARFDGEAGARAAAAAGLRARPEGHPCR
jgi:hypothetical protein